MRMRTDVVYPLEAIAFYGQFCLFSYLLNVMNLNRQII